MFKGKDRATGASRADAGISIIGPGMTVTGDVTSSGTVRIQGEVQGTVRADRAVVVGKEGLVEGEILTPDALISGSVKGRLIVETRLEVQATAEVDGEVQTPRIQVEEGARLNGKVRVGEPEGPVERRSAPPVKPQRAEVEPAVARTG